MLDYPDFIESPDKACVAVDDGKAAIIAFQGEPAYALISYAEYVSLLQGKQREAMRAYGAGEIEAVPIEDAGKPPAESEEAKVSQVRSGLQAFNAEQSVGGPRAKAFRLVYEEGIHAFAAHVVLATGDAAYSLPEKDEFNRQLDRHLGDIVAFVYSRFLSIGQYGRDRRDGYMRDMQDVRTPTSILWSDFAKLSPEEQGKKFSELAKKADPEQTLEKYRQRVRRYEIFYEMSSAELSERLADGRQRKTADIANWLFFLDVLRDLEEEAWTRR